MVTITPTGYNKVDRAAQACIISGARALADGVEFEFAPTTYLPCGIPPDKEKGRAMAVDPIQH